MKPHVLFKAWGFAVLVVSSVALANEHEATAAEVRANELDAAQRA